MRTWEDYKKRYVQQSKQNQADMKYIEAVADIVVQIIRAREEKGLSQAELAQLCGLKQSAISRMESLNATPQLDTVFKILQPLGLKLEVVHS